MSRPLSVLYVCLSPGWGGLEMYLHRTGAPLAARGHRVAVACRPGSRVAEACRAAGLAVHGVPGGPLHGLGIPRLAGLLRDLAVDVIHVHKSSDLGRVVLARRLAGRGRIVFTEHMGGRRSKRDPYHAWVYRQVHRVLSISEDVRGRNLEALPIRPAQSRTLYGGVDLSAYAPEAYAGRGPALRREFRLPGAALLVGLVGRISAMKGHETLLEAAARLAPQHPEAHFVLVGDGSGDHGGEPAVLADLERRARAPELQGRVHFTGYTTRVPEVTSVLDVATLCSENEAFGLALIEAMALGRPVVASRAGAVPEIIDEGRTGLLYAPGDPADLAAQLARLLADPGLRRSMGAAAAASARERFSMDRHVDELEAVYAEVLREPPGGPT